MKPEQYTNQIIRKSLLEYFNGGFYLKIPDVGLPGKKGRFMVKRPFDIIFYYNGKLFAIETKTVKNGKRINLNKIRKHQIEGLARIYKNNGHSYVAIHFWNKGSSNIYFIDIMDFLYICENYESITEEEIRKNHFDTFYSTVKNGIIDLEMLNYV